jgi:hypothetical protein
MPWMTCLRSKHAVEDVVVVEPEQLLPVLAAVAEAKHRLEKLKLIK